MPLKVDGLNLCASKKSAELWRFSTQISQSSFNVKARHWQAQTGSTFPVIKSLTTVLLQRTPKESWIKGL